MQKYLLPFISIIALISSTNVKAQDCKQLIKNINDRIEYYSAYIDNEFTKTENQPYLETYIMYPVLNRYYRHSKYMDTMYLRKYPDFAQVIFGFRGVYFANNKYKYFKPQEVISKTNNNDYGNEYFINSVCMLCSQYKLPDSVLYKMISVVDTSNQYAFLHKALQLDNAWYNKCIAKKYYDSIRIPLVDSLMKMVIPYPNPPNANIDVQLEAALMASILDAKQNISDEVYEALYQTFFNTKPIDVKQYAHSIIVLYWLLNDYKKKIFNTIF